MLEPIDFAIAIHKICEKDLIPFGRSPEHDLSGHAATSKWYVDAINTAGLDVTGEEAVNAAFAVNGWQGPEHPWPGHPNPEDVINYLIEQGR